MRRSLGLLLLSFAIPSGADAEPVTIDHTGGGCLVAGQDVRAGTLRVISGEVESVADNVITFRLRGVAGERVAFTFRRLD